MRNPLRRAPVTPRDTPPGYTWNLTSINDNITRTRKGAPQAWFVFHPVAFSYLSVAAGEAIIASMVDARVRLMGRDFHELVLPQPYPVQAWARAHDLNTPNPIDPEVWAEHMRDKQIEMSRNPLPEHVAFIGITLNHGKGEKMTRDIASVTSALADTARPATQHELEWLVNQTRALTLPAPFAPPVTDEVEVDAATLAGIHDRVTLDPGRPGGDLLHLTAVDSGTTTTRHVSVSSVGRVPALVVPEEHQPWLAHALAVPGAVLSVRGYIQPSKEAAKAMTRRLGNIMDQHNQYAAHPDIHKPADIDATYAEASEAERRFRKGRADQGTVIHFVARVAIGAATEADARAARDTLHKHMGDAPYLIEMHTGRDQEALYREFTPGEPLSSKAHMRRHGIRKYSAGIPQVSSVVGDTYGTHWGSNHGGEHFTWDLHGAMERHHQSGLTPFVGALGSGKSFVGGLMLHDCALRGVWSTGLDPSGTMARIVTHSKIKDHSARMDILRSASGTFSPYAVIPTPTLDAARADDTILELPEAEREDAAKDLWERRLTEAEAERKGLAFDTLRQCLPHVLASDPQVVGLLLKAVREVGGSPTAGLTQVIHLLKDTPGLGEDIYGELHDLEGHPQARLFLHPRTSGDGSGIEDKTLLMMAMPGLVLPQRGSDPSQWTVTERLAVPLVNLAAHYATARIYRRPMRERKLVVLDEAHFLTMWASGQALMNRLERDSRKWNVRVLVLSQDTETALPGKARALAHDAIVGYIEDEGEQRAALPLLHMPVGQGYESIFTRLRPMNIEALPPERQWRDYMVRVNGRTGRVRFDTADAELKGLLQTQPDQDEASGDGLRSPGGWLVGRSAR